MYAVSTATSAAPAALQGGPARVPCIDSALAHPRVHIDMRRQQVGRAQLRREDVTLIQAGRVVVLAQALGPARLWGYLLDSALDAFTDGYLKAGQGSVAAQLHQGLRLANHCVRTRIDALIERRGADVSLLAIGFDGPSLHLLGVGAFDTYLYRRKSLRRIGPSEPGQGMFKGSATSYAEHVEPGDVLFAGSRAVCDAQVLQRLSIALEHDRSLSPQAIVDTLGGAAAEQSLGAAAVALRIAATF
ncbi:MAG: hypothetical protein JWN04_1200 [Myxococcaceae bacterium]|nr:hypothetical protein [Myxococcaceae bacterium]